MDGWNDSADLCENMWESKSLTLVERGGQLYYVEHRGTQSSYSPNIIAFNVCDKSTGYYTFTRLKHLNNAGRNIQQGNFL